jgi:hypothetical protein
MHARENQRYVNIGQCKKTNSTCEQVQDSHSTSYATNTDGECTFEVEKECKRQLDPLSL